MGGNFIITLSNQAWHNHKSTTSNLYLESYVYVNNGRKYWVTYQLRLGTKLLPVLVTLIVKCPFKDINKRNQIQRNRLTTIRRQFEESNLQFLRIQLQPYRTPRQQLTKDRDHVLQATSHNFTIIT